MLVWVSVLVMRGNLVVHAGRFAYIDMDCLFGELAVQVARSNTGVGPH